MSRGLIGNHLRNAHGGDNEDVTVQGMYVILETNLNVYSLYLFFQTMSLARLRARDE